MNTARVFWGGIAGGRGVKKWMAKEGNYTYAIEEGPYGDFDLTIDNPFSGEIHLWFPSYRSARDYLRHKKDFTGRMKLVKEGGE